MKGSSQVLRQVVVIIVILAVWSGVFIGYLALTKTGEEPSVATAENAQVSFSSDVLPVLEARCQRCHGPGRAEVDLRLDSYDDVLAGSSNGSVVVPGSADTSYLVDLIKSGAMPFGAAKLPEAEIQTIVNWVNAGALDN
jgi:mono/diheme cytochrome c family protein